MFIIIIIAFILRIGTTTASLRDEQIEFMNLLEKVETAEKGYGEYISDGLMFHDKKTYSLDWYKKYRNIYWNYDKNCLYTKVQNVKFPIKDYSCLNKSTCYVGRYIIDLTDKKTVNLYSGMLKRFINIFKLRLKEIYK